MSGSPVYQDIRKAIQSGELLPGSRLVESELSERFSSPRSKVRSALFLLEHDRLVEHRPNRGATVRSVSVEEAHDILEARSVLEGLAARRAAERATTADDRALDEVIAQMRTQVDGRLLTAASEANMRLHGLVTGIADQPTLKSLIESLNSHLVRYRYRTILAADRPERSFEEHRAVVEAIHAREPDAAEAAMRNHLAQVWATLTATAVAEL